MNDDATTAFKALLERFSACAEANDGAGLAALFCADGVYDDYFFGEHRGHEAIAAMLARFHEGGEAYRWEFFAPLTDGTTGYASYRFSYRSRIPESVGRTIAFEGMCRLSFEDGRIARYAEVFDRGVAFAQLGFAPGKVVRLLEKYADAQNTAPAMRPHFGRFTG